MPAWPHRSGGASRSRCSCPQGIRWHTGQSLPPLSALGQIPLVLWPRDVSPRSYDEIIALCHHAGVVPHVGAEGHSVQTLLALVAAGFGAAVLADSHRALRRVGVTPRALAGTSTVLHLVWRADDTSPLLERVRNVVAELQHTGAADHARP
ncbi:LysR family substrate-binding domain-containing protein [Nonomuraea sp. NPDC005983]|uniref:LysR family substrate-binding domain-containing protein n=1 Tax=Nonomuraea sp. NPDC005983 TaxID=3155595 RepID=UPI0033BBCCAD